MARQLWLLRHAEAEPHGARRDPERRLTGRGESQSRAAGDALREIGVHFEAVLVSPKVRAQQTARLAAERQDPEHPWTLETHEPLAEGYDGPAALEDAARMSADGRILLVGHEPDLSGVIGQLTGGRVHLSKGGLAALRLVGGGGELVLLERPRDLLLIGRA